LLNLGYVEVVFAGSVEGRKDADDEPLDHIVDQLDKLHVGALAISAGSKSEASVIAAVIGATDPARAATARARSAGSPQTLAVVFAGSAEVATVLRDALPQWCDFHHISTVDWTADDFAQADLDAAVLPARPGPDHRLYEIQPAADHEGVTSINVAPGASAHLARFLQAATAGSVCIVDVGGRSTSILSSHQQPEKSRRPGVLQPEGARASVGTAQGIDGALRFEGRKDIERWLPFDASTNTLEDFLANRSLRPWAVAHEPRQLMVEQAVARACGRAVRRGELRTDLLIATGGIVSYPRLGQTLLTLLDIAQPSTPCRLLVDQAAILPRLMSLGRVDATVAASILKHDAFLNAGVCLSLLGDAKPGDRVAEISIDRDHLPHGGAPSGEDVHEIRYGTITVIPLRANEQTGIRITTARKFSFGIEGSETVWSVGSAEEGKSPSAGVAGGLVGLVVDARGRPIESDQDPARRQARLMDWLRSLDAFDPEVFSVLD